MKKIFLITTLLWTASLHAQGFEGLLKEFTDPDPEPVPIEIVEKPAAEKPTVPVASSSDMARNQGQTEIHPARNTRTNGVVLQGLDKTTARVFILEAPLDKQIEFGPLHIVVQRCEKVPTAGRKDSMAFLTITEAKPGCPAQKLFSGWMFASSPALSALDHPLYDVWIKECKNVQ